jgi:hypothetical protein
MSKRPDHDKVFLTLQDKTAYLEFEDVNGEIVKKYKVGIMRKKLKVKSYRY